MFLHALTTLNPSYSTVIDKDKFIKDVEITEDIAWCMSEVDYYSQKEKWFLFPMLLDFEVLSLIFELIEDDGEMQRFINFENL